MKTPAARSGFTLIELMIALAIMATLFGIGLSRYAQFNQSRKVKEAAKNFRSDLNFARAKALAGDKAAGCDFAADRLDSWYLRTAAHGYALYCNCGSDFLVKTVGFSPTDITLSPAGHDVRFRPLAQGVVGAATFTLTWGSYQETVTVSASGEIN